MGEPEQVFIGVDFGKTEWSVEVQYEVRSDGTVKIISLNSWQHDLELPAEPALSKEPRHEG